MADNGLGLLDDTPQATPLDLLINAISGSPYHFTTADDGAGGSEDATGAAPDAIAAYLGGAGAGDADAVAHAHAHVPDVNAVDVDVNHVDADVHAVDVGHVAAASVPNESLSRKRSAEDPGSPRMKKIARTLSTHFARQPALPGVAGAFSTVEVWHPKTGQKSYGKERRILQPPPTLRVTGPLAPLLSEVTLSALLNPDPATGPVLFSSQTHHIGSGGETATPEVPEASGRGRKGESAIKKRQLREAAAKTGWGSTLPWERNKTVQRSRDELADGLTFPGLWVGEDTGKSKEFRLELTIPQPRSENETTVEQPNPETAFVEQPPPHQAHQPLEEQQALNEQPPLDAQPPQPLGEQTQPIEAQPLDANSLESHPLETQALEAHPLDASQHDLDASHPPLDEAALRRVLGAAEMGPLILDEEDQNQAIKLVAAAAALEQPLIDSQQELEQQSFMEHQPLTDQQPLADQQTMLQDHESLIQQQESLIQQQEQQIDPSLDQQQPLSDPQPATEPPTAVEQPATDQQATPAEPQPEPKPWARFVSDPLTIVSKPSQKTAKARSMAGCLLSSDFFSLVVRVNAQTVRTKFMKLDTVNDTPILGARTGKWSPFRFDIIERAVPPEPEDKSQRRFKVDLEREKSVVTYGSIVQLVDVKNGTRSDSFRLVRVDKNEVVIGADHGHPVSELQRIGLVRVIDGKDDMEGGGRWYLSAPGAVAGAGEVNTTRARPVKKETEALQEAPAPDDPATLGTVEAEPEPAASRPTRKKKTKRHALARAAVTEEQEGSTAAGLVWHRAQQREGEYSVTEGKVATTRQATIETVDDWMCWVLSGVWCFSYSFFNGLGDSDGLSRAPLDVVPRLLINPNLRVANNTVELTLSAFFIPDPETGAPEPFSVYLGPIGPLNATTWRSAAPKEKYYDPGALYPAYPYSGTMADTREMPEDRRVMSNFPYSVPHVIASVELPSVDEIVRTMEQYSEPEAAPVEPPEPPADDAAWLGVMGPATELTIQEAIRNAGKTHPPEHNIAAALQAPVGKDDFESLIDPTFEPEAAAAPPPAPAPAPSETAPTASTITMHAPEQPKEALAPLPLLLVRPDGVGHGIGWSIVASQRREGDTTFGLQIVQTSALGQPRW